MNEPEAQDDPPLSAQEAAFAIWREDPAIRHLIGVLFEKPDAAGIEALLQSAFEMGWSSGYERAME
jgi:hypothetical protein